MRRHSTSRVIILLITLLLLLTSCGSKGIDTTNSYYPQNNQADQDGDFENKDEVGIEPDKIVTTVSIEMETKEFISTSEKLDSFILKYKGYVQNSDVYFNDYIYGQGLKYSDYSIRIPQENLEDFVNEVMEIGNIIAKNRNKLDITKQYKDSESRLKVLEVKEERILTLLEVAEKIEDIIVLENQLSDVIYQKESLIQELAGMDDRVNYSTINLSIREVAKLSSGGNVQTPFLEKLKIAFTDSLYFFTRNIGDFVIGVIYFLPYGLVLGLLGYLGYRYWIKSNKNTFKSLKPKDKDVKE